MTEIGRGKESELKQPNLAVETARFLIVDDEPTNVRLLEEILREWGCNHVFSTTDARQTSGLYQEFLPDIILLDWMMPHMNGLAVMLRS